MTYQARDDDDLSDQIYTTKDANKRKYYIWGGVGLFIFVVVIIIIIAVATTGDKNSDSNNGGNSSGNWPIVVTSWNMQSANDAAWTYLSGAQNTKYSNSLNAVAAGCKQCENEQCDSNVGPYTNPSWSTTGGEVTLGAMLMYGPTHDAASVGGIRNIPSAIDAARSVMYYSKHAMLVGEQATTFLSSTLGNTGFVKSSLENTETNAIFTNFMQSQCQNSLNSSVTGNFFKNIQNNTNWQNCDRSQYQPITITSAQYSDYTGCSATALDKQTGSGTHDSVGIIAIDANGRMSVGTSTSGLQFKLGGRVSDAAIIGSGGYVEQGIGGAIASGEGDVLLKFSPAKAAVTYMKLGNSPRQACSKALDDMTKYCPTSQLVVLCMDSQGEVGEAHSPNNDWVYAMRTTTTGGTVKVTCYNSPTWNCQQT